jgi:hypothetical protein
MTYAVYVTDAGDKCWGVFTGDALFVGDTGRTDLPDPERTGDNAGILYDSIHRKIAPLGDHTLLFPAHGAGSACGGNISERDDSTLGIEKGTNPVFRKSRRDFVAHKLAEKMARPPYFLHMEKVNLLPGRPLKRAPALDDALDSLSVLAKAEGESLETLAPRRWCHGVLAAELMSFSGVVGHRRSQGLRGCQLLRQREGLPTRVVYALELGFCLHGTPHDVEAENSQALPPQP